MIDYTNDLHDVYVKSINAFAEAYPEVDETTLEEVQLFCRLCARYIWNQVGVEKATVAECLKAISLQDMEEADDEADEEGKSEGESPSNQELASEDLEFITEEDYSMPVPDFFAEVIRYDQRNDTNLSRKLSGTFQLLCIAFAMIDEKLTEEEAQIITVLLQKLLDLCDEQGVAYYENSVDPYEFVNDRSNGLIIRAEKIDYYKLDMQNLLFRGKPISTGVGMNLPLGKKEDGTIFMRDLSEIPHIMICGYTGSGKSAFTETLLAMITSNNDPEQVKTMIYDSTGVEYYAFNSIPNMLQPVVTEREHAVAMINWLLNETRRRLKQFSKTGTKDILTYNAQVGNMLYVMPEIYVIMDDFYELSLIKEALDALLGVLRDGRIVGIHVIAVTSLASGRHIQQRLISNMACRISFRIGSKAESKMILGIEGAEKLDIPGEMYFKMFDDVVRCQAVYATYENIMKVTGKQRIQYFEDIRALGDVAVSMFAPKPKVKIEIEIPEVNKE